MSASYSPAEGLVAQLARELDDGAVVATGVASPLAILAIAVAQATHAPRLTYLACVGALNPVMHTLWPSSEDLRYLEGRQAEVTIPDLLDHARRGRVDTVFFGAAEVDAQGRTNMSAIGSLDLPRTKLPGLAGAASLRQWVHKPVLVVPRQSKRNLVPRVQVASTQDAARPVRLVSDLGVFTLGPDGAQLEARHPWTQPGAIPERTGFAFAERAPLPITQPPDGAVLEAIRAFDPLNLRDAWVGA